MDDLRNQALVPVLPMGPREPAPEPEPAPDAAAEARKQAEEERKRRDEAERQRAQAEAERQRAEEELRRVKQQEEDARAAARSAPPPSYPEPAPAPPPPPPPDYAAPPPGYPAAPPPSYPDPEPTPPPAPPPSYAQPPPSYPPAAAAPKYFHIAPNGAKEPFSAADNATIFAAQEQGARQVRVADVALPDGRVLQFEVRFGAHAVSQKMPSPSPTGLCQVNLGNQNTRIVERVDAKPSAPPPAADGPMEQQLEDKFELVR